MAIRTELIEELLAGKDPQEVGAQVNLVFSDVVMAGKTGFELASWIRGHHPKMPMLLTSGYPDIAGAPPTHLVQSKC